MELSPRQHRALAAIADTFAPGVEGLPAASAIGVPDAIAAAIGRNPRADARRQIARLLSAWELAAKPGRRFSTLSLHERERVLRAWRDSTSERRRSAYKVFRKGVLHHYFGLPGAARDAIGYPGPPELAQPEPSRTGRLVGEVECDVCIVGSGTGGATAAAVLAEAGLDVLVLEAGGDGGYRREELDALWAHYLEAAGAATEDQSIDLLIGATLGGGATINWTTCLRPPAEVLEEWRAYGLDVDVLERGVDAMWERLDVNEEYSGPSGRDAVLERGLRELGWHVAAQPRNVRNCEQGRVCGTCGFGCPLGAKVTPSSTWPDHVRVALGAQARRVLVERGAAIGVDAGNLRVRARAVVAACGAFHTPALLARSGLANANIGRNLHLHPVTLLAGEMEEDVRPWEGPLQSRYSEEHARLDGAYGVRYETPPVTPGLFGAALPWEGAREVLDLARRYARLAPVFPLVRDRDAGEVVVGRDGEPIARYRVSRYDLRHMRAGFAGAARVLEAAGARRIVSTHARPVVWERGRGGIGRFLAEADMRGWEPNQVLYASAHVMGTARMGHSPTIAAVDPVGESWEVANLFVCDGSAFPTPSGVNPMITIAGLAYATASGIAARLT
jgi:choline dehydrogenase-like flavoprotein